MVDGISALLAAEGTGVLPPCLISLLGTLGTPCGVCRLVRSTVATKRRYLLLPEGLRRQHTFHHRAESDALIGLRSNVNAPRHWPESV